jgi:hypothetical protein
MKYILILFSLILLSQLELQAQIPYDSLVLCLPFNGNCTNEASTTYQLVNKGATLCNDRFNIPESAFNFNGRSGLLLSNQTVNNQSKPQSISLWFKTGNENNVTYNGLLFGFVGPHISRFHVGIKNGQIITEYGDSDYVVGRSPQKYNDTKWHHLVFTSNGDNLPSILYIDGDSLMQVDGGINSNNTVVDIKIGGDKIQNYYTGKIDDIRIYKKMLSPVDVKFLYYESPCIRLVTVTDTVHVTVTDTTHITVADTIKVTFHAPTQAPSISSGKGAVTVHPNPVKNTLFITVDNFQLGKDYHFEIYDIYGRLVLSQDLVKQETSISKQLIGPRGKYILKVFSKTKLLKSEKLIVE